MRRIGLAVIVLLLAGILVTIPVRAAGRTRVEPEAGTVLCAPGLPVRPGRDCLVGGPADYLDRMAANGVPLPLRPLPARAPDPDLAYIQFNYARVVSGRAPIYASLEDAVRGKKPVRRLDEGFDFISYTEIVEAKGGRYFKLRSGQWMNGGDLSRISPPRFQGLVFDRTPERAFGWILHPTEATRTPGYDRVADTGRHLQRYDLVQIYATQRIDGLDWYLIGPDEWIEQRLIGRVVPFTTPPQGVDNGRWIEVNLYEQTVVVYEDNRLVYATLTSSGLPGWWTRPGLFQITIKMNQDTMRGAFEPDRSDYYYLQDVPWTMYFDESRALHGAYWHNGFGYPRSHGCVNLAPGDARWIFDWARDGEWVYVWDPSGKTPFDPDIYTPGGA